MARLPWLLTMVLLAACAGRGPELHVADPVWDVGIIASGTAMERRVALTNAGDAPLIIEKVEQCCGFTGELAEPTTIAPGGRTELLLQIDTFKKVGDLQAEITLVSNDRRLPRFPLAAVGQVVPKIHPLAELIHGSLDLGVVEQGATLPLALRIDNPGNAPLTVREVEQRGSLLQVGPLPVVPPGGSATLAYRFEATTPGPIDERLVISTNDALNRTLTARVQGYVVPREERRSALTIYPIGEKAAYDVNEKAYRYRFRLHNQGTAPVRLAPGEAGLAGVIVDLPAELAPGEAVEAAATLPVKSAGEGQGWLDLRLWLPFAIQ